ncbi:MAG: hypothetical protein ACYS5F_15580, partial [Planctomycetota bacterium]
FEGDKAVEFGVAGLVYFAHASGADFLKDFIVGDGFADKGHVTYLKIRKESDSPTFKSVKGKLAKMFVLINHQNRDKLNVAARGVFIK